VGKFALLIGVSEFEEEDLPALPSALKDIQAMQAILQNPELGSFSNVEILKNSTRQEMEEAIETLFANRKKDDLLLFYFSGHGITDEKGKLYLVTRQTKKDRGKLRKSTAVAATVLHENMSSSSSKHQVLILDSCFSGAIAEGLTGKSDSRVDIQRELGGEGRAILTSSSAVQKSFHIQGYDLSIYTHYLIEGIQTGDANQDGDDYISADELHEYAKKKLEQEAPTMTPQFFPVREGHKIKLVRSPKVTPIDPDPCNIPEDEPTAEEGVDYTQLEYLLKMEQWEAANQETADLMHRITLKRKHWKAFDQETNVDILLGLAKRWSEDWLTIENIQNFPCTDLHTIDRLWSKYSRGRFGFSVQKLIYESSTDGNWKLFGEAVGWRKGFLFLKEWIPYNQVNFDISAPRGHLPICLCYGKRAKDIGIGDAPNARVMHAYAGKEYETERIVEVVGKTRMYLSLLFARIESCKFDAVE
jgi:uncharacterized caspase-like protein